MTKIPATPSAQNNPRKPFKVAAVVVAAGSSTRYGSDKLEQQLFGKPVWRVALEAFSLHHAIDQVILVGNREVSDDRIVCVAGGETRQDSARNGVRATDEDCDVVLVHDAARPFVTRQLIDRVIEAAKTADAVFPAVAVTDTIRKTEAERYVTVDRAALVAVQTPQAGRRADLLRAYDAVSEAQTDDIGALEAIGLTSSCVPGDPQNKKVTHVGDLLIPTETRSGIGYDVHAFSTDPERPMWLGGIEFPDDKPGLDGHSDADALIHSVVDALLGAAGMGDIGQIYSNSDPRWKNCSSSRFLAETSMRLRDENWHIINIDVSVLAERPRIMRRSDEIREALARAVGISVDRVSVKATTNEKLGAIGRGEGIASFAVATLSRPV